MLQGKKLRGKCYKGKNVTGENVTGENVSGENGVSPIIVFTFNISKGSNVTKYKICTFLCSEKLDIRTLYKMHDFL